MFLAWLTVNTADVLLYKYLFPKTKESQPPITVDGYDVCTFRIQNENDVLEFITHWDVIVHNNEARRVHGM